MNNFFPFNSIIFNTKILYILDESQSLNNNSNYFNIKFPLLNTTRNFYLKNKNKTKTDSSETNDLPLNSNKKKIKLEISNNLHKEKSIILLEINTELKKLLII